MHLAAGPGSRLSPAFPCSGRKSLTYAPGVPWNTARSGTRAERASRMQRRLTGQRNRALSRCRQGSRALNLLARSRISGIVGETIFRARGAQTRPSSTCSACVVVSTVSAMRDSASYAGCSRHCPSKPSFGLIRACQPVHRLCWRSHSGHPTSRGAVPCSRPQQQVGQVTLTFHRPLSLQSLPVRARSPRVQRCKKPPADALATLSRSLRCSGSAFRSRCSSIQ